MTRRTQIAIVSALAIVAIVAVVASRLHGRSEQPAPVAALAPATALAARPAAAPAQPAPAMAVPAAAVDDQLARHVRERYGANIDRRYIQMRMLEALMRELQRRYPDRWREVMLDILRQAFPGRYEELAALLQQRLDYDAWMDANRARLNGLGADERRAALWEGRQRIFGDAAAEIWASEIKNQAVADALRTIDAHEGGTVADKLSMYKQALTDVYEEQADGTLQRHQHELMNRFLSMESVQRDLSAMSPEERSGSLREIRKGMGLSDAALARWDTLDRERDQRWDNGQRYMQERAALVARLSGEALERALDELRARYFGGEADIIAGEEDSGFYRFEQQRRWGQN